MNLYIVGAGIVTENIPNYSYLLNNKIQYFNHVDPRHDFNDYLYERINFQSRDIIAREDRSLLNLVSQLSIDASRQSMSMAQGTRLFDEREKECFPIFSATEAASYDLSCLDKLLKENDNSAEKSINYLGDIKQYLNPLDMLRILSTNPLYHLSKVFGLNGGGYPVKKMSLSGLSALEWAALYLDTSQFLHGLVTSVGNIRMAENLTVFMKMDLLRKVGMSNGIIPAYGAASLVLSTDGNTRETLGEILNVYSIYQNYGTVIKENWLTLYKAIEEFNEQLYVIYYNNGVNALFKEEQSAVYERFPSAVCFSYKQYIGYTGKSNNLVDLVIALSDERIPKDSPVLINGIGTGVGLGCILIKKH